jgi:hypothetical protein
MSWLPGTTICGPGKVSRKARAAFELLGLGALRQVARYHHHIRRQPRRQLAQRPQQIRVDAAEMQVGQMNDVRMLVSSGGRNDHAQGRRP